jgi:uncharacterized protein YcbX
MMEALMKFASRKKTDLVLEALFVYPIKGLPPLSLSSATLMKDGLAHDRIWQLFDAKGRILNYKNLRWLNNMWLSLRDDVVWLHALGMPDEPLSEKSSAWLSRFLRQSCTLRLVADDPKHRHEPISLISLQSLAKLNASLSEPFSIQRFRPNLVVSTNGKAFAESDWHQIYVPGIVAGNVSVRLGSVGASLRPHMFTDRLAWRRTWNLWPSSWGTKLLRMRERVSSPEGNLVFGLYLRPKDFDVEAPNLLQVGQTLVAT